MARLEPPKEVGAAPRYYMLETLREYGREKLRAAGEEHAARTRHLNFLLGLAETQEPQLYYGAMLEALAQLEAEHDNFRAGLEWGLQHAPMDALRLVGALGRFWDRRGYVSEGAEWVRRALAHAADTPTAARAKALRFAGGFARLRGEYAMARKWIEASLAMYRELNDKAGIAVMLNSTGFQLDYEGDYVAAQEYYLASQAAYREIGEAWGVAMTTSNLGSVALALGETARARELNRASSAALTALGDKSTLAVSIKNEAEAAYQLQDFAQARALLTRALALNQELGETRGVALVYCDLGANCAALGENDAAQQYYNAALQTFVESGDLREVALVLEGLAELAARAENFLRAARLWGAAEMLHTTVGAPRLPATQESYARAVSEARAKVGDAAFDAAWAEGGALTLGQMAQL